MQKTKQNLAFAKQFGSFVKKKRISKQWTQQELASRLGNNSQNISRIERGELTPNLYTVYQIAEAFESDLTVFIRGFKFSQKEK